MKTKEPGVFEATVKATGEQIQVYRHKVSGGWVKYGGIGSCSTTYKENEVEVKR